MQQAGQIQYHLQGGTPYLTLSAFSSQPWLRHAFSTRLGGVSEGCFSSMNLGFDRGDKEESVLENYRRFCGATGFALADLIATAQTHGTRILRVGRAQRGAGILRPKPWSDVDGLITNAPGAALCVYGADCVPILLADPVRRAIGVAHAGWRGTVAGIALRAVRAMQEAFGTQAADLLAGIGPSIGPCCFEVDAPVARAFQAVPLLRPQDCVQAKPDGKFQIDLWRANEALLRSAGVQHVAQGAFCTQCHARLLWSHRATGGKRGGNCGILEIREEAPC